MSISDIIGSHPLSPHPCGEHMSAEDKFSAHALPHRTLDENSAGISGFVDKMSVWLVDHHVSPEAVERERKRREALARQRLPDHPARRFPDNDKTRKGNWAEVLLAEYLTASSTAGVPVFRLRYNPNVDQSMKGDDVLAFDLGANPVRIVVGEAKFRGTPRKDVVEELIAALERSHSGNIPASLQFVADRLFESGDNALGEKVAECNGLFAQGLLRLDYVGLLVSDSRAHRIVTTNARSKVESLGVISLALTDAAGTVEASFSKAEALL